MRSDDTLLKHLAASGALMEGHYVLSSGLHSGRYLQCALALQFPSDAARFGRMIAESYAGSAIETVASPAIGGLVIGFAVAEALNVRFVWTERQAGIMTMRRGFTIKRGERILVVEDVITTGGSTRECIAALTQNGGDVIAAASLVDRSNGVADVGVPRTSLLSLNVETFDQNSCPLCAAGTEAVKPGSRTAASN